MRANPESSSRPGITRTVATRKTLWVCFALSLVGIAISLSVFKLLRLRENRVLSSAFRDRTHERAKALQREFDVGSIILESLAAFRKSSGGLTREEFDGFTRIMRKRHPSVQALSYNPLVKHAERAAFEALAQGEGFPGYRITEYSRGGVLIPAADRPEYVVAKYITTYGPNERGLGFDINSESIYKEALDRARDRKLIAATGPIRLVQEPGHHMGFLLFNPVYDHEDKLDSFMVGEFRLGDLVNAALRNFKALDIEMELLDELGENAITLYRTPALYVPPDVDDFLQLQEKDVIQLGGRNWILRTRPLAGFAYDYRTWIPWSALLIGLSITGLLVAYVGHLNVFNFRVVESEEKFRQLAEHINEVFWTMDLPARRVIYVSPMFKYVYGRDPAEIYEDFEVLFTCVHPDDQEILHQNLKLMSGGKQMNSQYRIIRPDGSTRWIRDRGFPLTGPNGPTGRVVGIATDITTRRKLEEERDQLQAKIQQAQKMEGLGVLAGGMAHDYNNLLTAILGHTELALVDLPEESPLRADLVQIERAGQRAADLTRQMLAYSGRGPSLKCYVLLTDIVESMKSLIASTVSNKAGVRYELLDDLPTIKGDANQIRQVVLNLTINAAEAAKALGGEICIRTGCIDADRAYLSASYFDHELLPGNYVFLEVSDQGSGMDATTLERIFDPFFSTRFIGRGLGLPAVIGIVRGHGGAIIIDTEIGKGSHFRLLFPVDVEPDE